MFVILKELNNPKDITLEFINEIKIDYIFYGITKDIQTENYMIVLNNKCKQCNYVCNAMHFKQNFGDWTSGNDVIDKYIQSSQLLAHTVAKKALEWISYDRFYNIKYNEKTGVYRANWVDGYINNWDIENQNWKRLYQDMFVSLKSLNDPTKVNLELTNKTGKNYQFYGITQDTETKNYMIVLNDICEKCNDTCDAINFQKDFKNWTSGNSGIDNFIQESQLSMHNNNMIEVIEWIPYNRFKNIEYIAKGGFGRVYKANWIDGYIDKWDNESQSWKRRDANMFVALKSLNNSKNITLKFMNEMILHHKVDIDHRIIRFYGITQDPETENYIMVLEYADNGSLRRYLDTDYNKLNWESKIICLYDIITGLKFVHEKNLIHRDLHHGNILKSKNKTAITDMGLCKPADDIAQKNNRYGILPYIAPEILLEQAYTKASDIYSFGIIMYEIISGLPPFHDVSHDEILAIKICKGLRPRFNIKVPHLIIRLIKSCLDANPLKRPEAEEIREILYTWRYEPNNKQAKELQAQIKEASIMDNNSSNNKMTLSNLSYETHSEASYTSRLLKFGNLPEPKNSDDYYEQNDNIISVESSVSLSLQIDISQLNINDDNLPEPKDFDNCHKQNDKMINVGSSASLSMNMNDDNLLDYHKQDNNLISTEYSGSLQIDISQLNIDKDEK
ncbi:kinase-like domain-containing protein [Rhizophagus clarus]|uniref:Kinase-like domain-containing protein n=1 Tax=Rhizophagus clarus TaxID=94130 RepID=A0A8H3M8C3_9GLOM|nr:kinase-like domain-containing protein [Rhizophagus clarus]